jgi:signal transduction histidine kinase
LTLSDLEYDIGSWLEEHRVAEAWMIANELAAAGYTKEELETLTTQLGMDVPGPLACLIASTISVTSLLSVIGQTTGQISSIVNALKSYSFLDQAPVRQVDVAEGIDNTLVLLRGKMSDSVSVTVDYAENLPEIDAFGSELNQVWTHLLDNALDAMTGKGEIRISAKASAANGVIVQVEDSGPGIPAEIQHRIFDAFFTTKEPGKGTGLGLHTVFNIVVNKHGGEISVESVPGRTVFTVILPPKPASEGN